MPRKLLKGLVTLMVLLLLYAPHSPFSQANLQKIPWTILLVLTLTYGISLTLDFEIPRQRRWAIAYLIFTGLSYLVVGILGVLRNGDLIEASAWRSLISPYLLISFFDQLAHHFPYTISRAPYEVVPFTDHRLFSSIVIGLAILAIVAAIGMGSDNRLAYEAWLVLLALLTLAFLGYVTVGFVSWGLKETVIPACWLASYIAAYVTARRRVQIQ